MKLLTVDYIKSLGFKKTDTTVEEDFYYEDWDYLGSEIALTVFITYWKNGKTTFDVDLDGCSLVNVGQFELKTLIKILPNENAN